MYLTNVFNTIMIPYLIVRLYKYKRKYFSSRYTNLSDGHCKLTIIVVHLLNYKNWYWSFLKFSMVLSFVCV